jgi:hypothetical protein
VKNILLSDFAHISKMPLTAILERQLRTLEVLLTKFVKFGHSWVHFGSRQCTNCGIGNAAGIMAGMIVGATLIPPISLQIFCGKWRRSTSNPDDSVSLGMPSEPVVAMASTSASGMDNAKGLAQQIERLPSDS